MKIKPHQYPFLPRQYKGRFYNVFLGTEHISEIPESLWRSLRMLVAKKLKALSFKPAACSALIHPTELPQVSDTKATHSIQWLGHASCLIQINNIHILTDPVFHSLSFLYKRHAPLPLSPAQLPEIDIVLISHNHRDHLDKKTILWLSQHKNPLFLVPEGDKKTLNMWGITKVEEFLWWESYQHNNITYTFVPGWHWSQRGLFDHNTSLWGGWIIQDGLKTIYFAGDTAYNKKYNSILEQQYTIDVALLPIGPGEPENLMRRSHINAELAGQLFLDIQAKIFIPIHWGTFKFGTDSCAAPFERLQKWWTTVIANRPGYLLVAEPLGTPFIF